MNTRLLYICSFLLIGLVSQAQAYAPTDSTNMHQVFVSTDITGITLLPFSAALVKNKHSQYRLAGNLQYVYRNTYAIDFAYGKEQLESALIGANFTNYKSYAEYIQVIAGVVAMEQKDKRFLFGLGATFGHLQQSGIVEIQDDYFDPYHNELMIDEKFLGWFTSLRFDYKFNPRLSCLFDAKLQAVNIKNKADTQVLHSNPGAGLAWNYNTKSVWSANISVHLKYRIFVGGLK